MTLSDLDVTVRLGRVADASGIARTYVETWRPTYAGMVPDRVLLEMSEDIQRERWHRSLDRPGGELVSVAEDRRHGIVGFAGGGAGRDSGDFGAEVFTLYVLPDAQGSGIGRGLLAHMFRAFGRAGVNSAMLWVLAENPSRFFYEAVGGERVAEREERLWGTNLPEIAYGWPDLKAVLASDLRSTGSR